MLPSHDKTLSLFRVEQFGGDALGVLKDVNRSSALVAIVGINAGLFDLMPAELCAHSEVILALSNGEKLGEFRLDADKPLQGPISFDRPSTRLPLTATIRLEQTVLSSWNSECYWPAFAVALGLGALFGVLLARSHRMEGPVADLDRALAAGEFKQYYQPIFAPVWPDHGLRGSGALGSSERLGGAAHELHSAGRIQRTRLGHDLADPEIGALQPARRLEGGQEL